MTGTADTISADPFHPGEVRLQESMGVRERMAEIGRKVIRDYMPDQHRDFFAQLPFILLGAVDRTGDVWASVAHGEPGFIQSPNPRTLIISAGRNPHDPADQGLNDQDGIGLLGIELHTRRRNRMNGTLRRTRANEMRVTVEHSFGNCPKYIQLRDFRFEIGGAGLPAPPRWLGRLDENCRDIIRSADTFFVATYADLHDGRQVDVSHRGGRPGFVHIDADDRMIIPDFSGNRHFNTLGNILINNRAGLLFIDFEKGALLQMTGEARLEENSIPPGGYHGSERFWSFHPRRIVHRMGAVPLRWSRRKDGFSPFLADIGSWLEDGDASPPRMG